MMNTRAYINQQLQNTWQTIQFWRFQIRLRRQIGSVSQDYKNYLDIQLRRTLSKKDVPLPRRARYLIDRTADLVNLSRCAVLCIGCRSIAEIDYFRDKGAENTIGIDLHSESKDILVMDMHTLTFETNRFDLIYSSHSLEHAYDVRKVADEIIRVARSGALIAIEVPVRYQPRGADLVDFEDAQTLHSIFQPYIRQVLWSDEQPAHSPQNEEGNTVVRTVFSISK